MASLKGILSITFVVSLSWLHVSLDSSSSIQIPVLSDVVKVQSPPSKPSSPKPPPTSPMPAPHPGPGPKPPS